MLRDHARLHFPAFLVQVLATAVGLLLALGLDQWRDQRRQAGLGRAHLAAIQAELRTNLAELEGEAKALGQQDAVLAEVARALSHPAAGGLHLDVRINFSIAALRHSAWDMAVAGQTPLRSDLERMGRLANAYESLRLIQGLNDQLLRDLSLLSKLIPVLEARELPPPAERRALAGRIEDLRAQMSLVMNTVPSTRKDLIAALAP